MNITRVSPGIDIAWRLDDHTDGWTQPDTVMLLHGIAETGDAFRGWVPGLSRRLRVMRVDLRGYGGSTQLADGEELDLEEMSNDIDRLVQVLGLGRVHIVGAKLGAQIGLVLAQRRVPWLASLSLAGVLLSPGGALAQWVPQWIAMVDDTGVEGWARTTMPGRMGSAMPPAGLEWWAKFMGATPPAAVKACFRMLPALGEPKHLESITCAMQVLVAVQPEAPGHFDQRQPLAEVRRFQQRIPNSRLREIQADSYHIAATHPDACAAAVADFIQEISA
ncbi:MAG: alpha/beta fold hydrolase [Pseudomonadota bacterium]